MQEHYIWKGKDLYLNIYLKPRAKKNALVGIHDNKLKIFLTSQPIDGAANKHLIEFIAENFHVAKRQVTIIKGETSSIKIIKIKSPDRQVAEKILSNNSSNTFKFSVRP